MGLKTNARALALIKSFEGLRLSAYVCPANVLTIGYGTTSGVTRGMKITEAEAVAFLVRDLAKFEKAVNENVKVTLNQNQFDALISFVYNVGAGAFASSTLLKKINLKDFAGAANEFLKWDKATVNGQKVALAGLTRRRQAERSLFLS